MKKTVFIACLIFSMLTSFAGDTSEIKTSYDGCNLFYSPYSFRLKIISVSVDTATVTICYSMSESNMSNLSLYSQNKISSEITHEEFKLLSPQQQFEYVEKQFDDFYSTKRVWVMPADSGSISIPLAKDNSGITLKLIGDRPNRMGRIALVFNILVTPSGELTILKREIRSAERFNRQRSSRSSSVSNMPCNYPVYR